MNFARPDSARGASPSAPLARRLAAFALDWGLFVLVSYGLYRWFDGATRTRATLDFPPHQAAAAARRLIPSLVLLYLALFVGAPALLGASPGKRLLGLRVVDGSGDAPGFLVLCARETFGKLASLVLDGVSLVEAALGRVTVHDRLFGTRVVLADESSVGDAPEEEWQAPALGPALGTVAAFAVLAWSTATQGSLFGALRFASFYLPHEAAHLVVGAVMPHLVAVFAGAPGQLLFPSVAAAVFARRGWTLQFSAALVWAAMSVVDIGRYAADAWDRELAMPMPINAEWSEEFLDAHDWWQLLSAGGVLRYARPLGGLIQSLGWVLLLGAAAWVLYLALRKPAARAPA